MRGLPSYSPGRLELLLSEHPSPSLGARLVAGATFRISALRAEVEWARRMGRAPRLTLPRDQDQVIVGRGPGCDCRLTGDTVSRRHALLLRRREAWTIEDLGSMNGTLLNGWPVVMPTEVRPGDVIAFGEVACRIAD